MLPPATQGWGVVAEEAIPAGRFIYEYCGELVDNAEAARRLQEYDALGNGHALLVRWCIPRTRCPVLGRMVPLQARIHRSQSGHAPACMRH
jgi:hypothetical protein